MNYENRIEFTGKRSLSFVRVQRKLSGSGNVEGDSGNIFQRE